MSGQEAGSSGAENSLPIDETGRIDVDSLNDEQLDALIEGWGLGEAEPKWTKEFNLRALAGFNDNVVQGAFDRDGSPYFGADFEAFLWRDPRKGKADIYVYFYGEYIRYTDAHEVNNESIAILQSRISKAINTTAHLGSVLQYTYADEVFDISSNDLETDTAILEIHQFEVRPFLKKEVKGGRFLQLDGGVQENLFRDSVDNYLKPLVKFGYGGHPFFRGRLGVSYEYGNKLYDSRSQRDSRGFSLPETMLELETQDIIGKWKRDWGKDRNLQTQTKLSVKLNRDNGSGYNDYDRYGISQKFTFKTGPWEVVGDAKYSYFDYSIQTVGFLNNALFERKTLRARGRVEREIAKKLKLYCEYAYEQSRSNRPEEEFDQHNFTVGIDRLF